MGSKTKVIPLGLTAECACESYELALASHFPARPQSSNHRSNYSDFEECKRRFKVVWSRIRADLTEADIEGRGAFVAAAANYQMARPVT